MLISSGPPPVFGQRVGRIDNYSKALQLRQAGAANGSPGGFPSFSRNDRQNRHVRTAEPVNGHCRGLDYKK
jgi:hypothetical protein